MADFTKTEHLDGKVTLYGGDNRDVLKSLPDNSVDAIVTDPPYALVSIQKRFGGANAKPTKDGDVYARASAGFMGKQWDTGEVAFSEVFWAECLRVLKPGGHVVAFSGTRTYHRMAVAIEDAGFEIRDQLGWVYGSGFPKSHDVSKGIDRMGGTPWVGFATMLDDLIKHAGYTYASLDRALGVKSSSCYWVRTDARGGLPPRNHYERIKQLLNPPKEFTDLYDKAEREVIAIDRRKNSPSGIVSVGRESVDVERKITAPATDAAKQWQGWGTALKPAWEPICLARKPLIGTVAENVLAYGTGAINIDGCRVEAEEGGRPAREVAAMRDDVAYAGSIEQGRADGSLQSSKAVGTTDAGRWPANIIHDGSDEVLAGFPDAKGQQGYVGPEHGDRPSKGIYGDFGARPANPPRVEADTSAARFFYCAKASRKDRDEGLSAVDGGRANTHPTVKPTALMEYLVRLVTPPSGTVLDPFMGSGSTGKACVFEGFKFIGIEREEEYFDIARGRIQWAIDNRDMQDERPVAAQAQPCAVKAANDNQRSLFDAA